MPARLIEHHHRMLVFSNGCGEAVEKFLHRRGIGVRQHKREGMIGAWFNGGEDIGKGKALVAEPRRAGTPLPPDMADTAFLADPRLILEEQANALTFVRMLKFFQERWGSF